MYVVTLMPLLILLAVLCILGMILYSFVKNGNVARSTLEQSSGSILYAAIGFFAPLIIGIILFAVLRNQKNEDAQMVLNGVMAKVLLSIIGSVIILVFSLVNSI